MTKMERNGRAYGMPAPAYTVELTEVGPGTPMGELMRRYWHPIGLISDATSTPKMVRALGEDLVLFRDRSGRPGLVYPRCCHRGASLFYGKVEDCGIRCCYHGWLFDVEGNCLEQPMDRSGRTSYGSVFRQPWYPVREQYGLIWAFMGPAEKQPALPRYECLETLKPGESVEADNSSIGSGGGVIAPCNWLQHFENVLDPDHLPVLHGTHSGPQFGFLSDPEQRPSLVGRKFSSTDKGVMNESFQKLPNGRAMNMTVEIVFPTLRIVPLPRRDVNIATQEPGFETVESIGWVLPIDDTHYRIYVAGRVTHPGQLGQLRSRFNGKLWTDMTPEEHQRFPGDFETQVSLGPITAHSEERLVAGDEGIVLIRRGLTAQLKRIEQGLDPVGISFDEDAPPIRLESGLYLGPVPEPAEATA